MCAAEELRKVQRQAQQAVERGDEAEWRRWQGVSCPVSGLGFRL